MNSKPIVVEFPTPPRLLSPNAGKKHNVHKMNRATTQARLDAQWATIGWIDVITRLWLFEKARKPLTLHIHIAWERGRQSMDPQNAISLLKASFDGIADAIGMNDKHFMVGTVTQTRDKAGKVYGQGYVRVTIEEEPE